MLGLLTGDDHIAAAGRWSGTKGARIRNGRRLEIVNNRSNLIRPADVPYADGVRAASAGGFPRKNVKNRQV
jgi:hypothetical protein